MVEVSVAIEKLRGAGNNFEDMSESLGAAATRTEELSLTEQEWGHIAVVNGLLTAYDAIQQKMLGLLEDGESTFVDIGGALRSAADGYQRDEDDGLHDVESIEV